MTALKIINLPARLALNQLQLGTILYYIFKKKSMCQNKFKVKIIFIFTVWPAVMI